ncbi:MAG: hypothetical protein CM15mP18_1510 [Methanobacteriota archaeon]|nr:MAG: hypothetical protein CM15mP18_1510 [Euryarchaeota archaeon]
MRAVLALLGVVLLAGTAAAGATNLVADGSVGYRQASLSWDIDASVAVNGAVLEVWTSNETLLNASSAEVHSTFLVGSTEGLAQPEPGAWYDDCSRTVDGVEGSRASLGQRHGRPAGGHHVRRLHPDRSGCGKRRSSGRMDGES